VHEAESLGHAVFVLESCHRIPAADRTVQLEEGGQLVDRAEAMTVD
jgi:hypothetical protein